MPANDPIGITDSGVGGISVLREALGLLPNESFIYFGDNGNAPYGTKDEKTIRHLGFSASRRLADRGVKALIVACNTTTAVALPEIIQSLSPMPVVGIRPSVQDAVRLAGDKKALIMATPATLRQASYLKMAQPYGDRVLSCPCPGLVELVEAGGAGIPEYLRALIPPEMKQAVGSIALGCTHYPFAAREILDFFGKDIPLVDNAKAVVLQMKALLEQKGLLSKAPVQAERVLFLTSGDAGVVLPLCGRLLNRAQGEAGG